VKTLFIIPAYNEELNIRGVIEDIRGYVPGADILVINDGSRDATGTVAKNLGVTVITLPYNLGIGAAMQTGYRYADMQGYDIAVQFDGDGQHRADQLDLLLGPILRQEKDIVIGSRFLTRGLYEAEAARIIAIRTLSAIISLLIGQKITDPTSGLRAVNRKALQFFCDFYPDDYPEPESLVLLHKAGFRIAEAPVLMEKRLLGNSSITLFRGVYYMVKVVLAVLVDMIKEIPRR
jgi:hypothetical protein